jgi:uncharacterized SAM-binding protein YcdF (DUF218 family)
MIWLKRFGKCLIIFIALLIAVDVIAVFTFAHWRPEIKPADAVIILGAAINTPAIHNRTLEGLQMYNQGKAEVMVLSGGKIADADISEAQYMEKVVKKNSATKPQYILEDQSHNTYENIKNSKAKLGDKGSVIIVSDQFHLARAVLLAKRAGFETVYWSAPKPTYYDNSDMRFYYFREIVAMLDYIPKFIRG